MGLQQIVPSNTFTFLIVITVPKKFFVNKRNTLLFLGVYHVGIQELTELSISY